MVNAHLNQDLPLPWLKFLGSISIAVAGIAILSSGANAAFLYDEERDGEISDNRLDPTFLGETSQGISSLTFSINNRSNTDSDLDYFSITIPEGLGLTQLILADYLEGDDAAFIGLQQGTIFTESPQMPNPANLLGYTHVGTNPAEGVNQVGDDLLPLMGLSQMRPEFPPGISVPNPIGFGAPLTAGDYVFWVQQTGLTTPPTQLQLDFVASPVPEPSSVLALLTCGGLGIGLGLKRGDNRVS